MREILFEGKRKDNGEWIEGYFGVFVGIPQIYVPFTEEQKKENEGHIFSQIGGLWYEVIPETVRQYTGMTDKNGKMIFEGDIIKHFNDLDNPDSYEVGTVLWDDHRCRFFRTSEQTVNPYRKHIAIGNECNYEVIGNIHDNPELLEGKDNEI